MSTTGSSIDYYGRMIIWLVSRVHLRRLNAKNAEQQEFDTYLHRHFAIAELELGF